MSQNKELIRKLKKKEMRMSKTEEIDRLNEIMN